MSIKEIEPVYRKFLTEFTEESIIGIGKHKHTEYWYDYETFITYAKKLGYVSEFHTPEKNYPGTFYCNEIKKSTFQTLSRKLEQEGLIKLKKNEYFENGMKIGLSYKDAKQYAYNWCANNQCDGFYQILK